VEQLAARLGVVASPGEFYGDAGADHVRLAVVQPDEALELLERRADGVSLT
jgi:aspartate/methionine/tyrosine aminotransferase